MKSNKSTTPAPVVQPAQISQRCDICKCTFDTFEDFHEHLYWHDSKGLIGKSPTPQSEVRAAEPPPQIKRYLNHQQRAKWERRLAAGMDKSEEFPEANPTERAVLWTLLELKSAEGIIAQLARATASLPEGPNNSPDNVIMGTPLTFQYVNHKGRTVERHVIPQRIYFGTTEYYPEPQWLLQAFDLDKLQDRTFSLNAALSASTEALYSGLQERIRNQRKELDRISYLLKQTQLRIASLAGQQGALQAWEFPASLNSLVLIEALVTCETKIAELSATSSPQGTLRPEPLSAEIEQIVHLEERVRELEADYANRRGLFWPPQNPEEEHIYEIRNGKTPDYVREHVNALVEIRMEAASAPQEPTRANGWISVETELPKRGEEVNAIYPYEGTWIKFLAHYGCDYDDLNKVGWWSDDSEFLGSIITYWKPLGALPDPPAQP